MENQEKVVERTGQDKSGITTRNHGLGLKTHLTLMHRESREQSKRENRNSEEKLTKTTCSLVGDEDVQMSEEESVE